MNTPRSLVIASRQSPLAMWQAKHIKSQLLKLYPQLEVSILGMTTKGDLILDKTLSKIGGKGLFIKELEEALLDGRADIAVHSMKDVPMDLPAGFTIAAIGARANPFDAFLSNTYRSISDMPQGAVVGTASLRREAELRARYPHLVVKPLRGNVQTRLKRLDDQEFDAIILAAAGLERLGLHSRIRSVLLPSESLPAPGQAALGIEIASRRQDLLELLSPLQCPISAACVTAERALARALGGSCQVPLGAYATEENGNITLSARIAYPDGSNILEKTLSGPIKDAEAIGTSAAHFLEQAGAKDIIRHVLNSK